MELLLQYSLTLCIMHDIQIVHTLDDGTMNRGESRLGLRHKLRRNQRGKFNCSVLMLEIHWTKLPEHTGIYIIGL